VAVQPDGKVIAVGMRFRGNDAQNDELFAVARYLPDGELDRTFSRDGLASVDFGFGDADASAVAVQRGGRTVVAGNGARNAYRTEEDFAVARLRANGGLAATAARPSTSATGSRTASTGWLSGATVALCSPAAPGSAARYRGSPWCGYWRTAVSTAASVRAERG
jgi:uncharacterized delta-60 repeat protein